MEKNKKIIIGVVIALLIIGFVLFNVFSLKSVKPTSFRVNDISMSKDAGIIFEGVIVVENPSLLDANIESIDYEIILDLTNEVISTGHIDGSIVPSKGSADFTFSQQLDWIPDVSTAMQLMNQEEIYVTIQGTGHAKLLWVIPVSSDFEAKVDIAAYIKNTIQQQVQSVMGMFGLR